MLSKHFVLFSKFINLSKQSDYEDLLNIDGIGETQVNSVKSFFKWSKFKSFEWIRKNFNSKKCYSKFWWWLVKNRLLVTGKLNGISRAEVKSLIEENSGKTVSNASGELNYLIIGDKPTKKKIDSAKQLKINVIDQAEFWKC